MLTAIAVRNGSAFSRSPPPMRALGGGAMHLLTGMAACRTTG
jgi:hypothetical protein